MMVLVTPDRFFLQGKSKDMRGRAKGRNNKIICSRLLAMIYLQREFLQRYARAPQFWALPQGGAGRTLVSQHTSMSDGDPGRLIFWFITNTKKRETGKTLRGRKTLHWGAEQSIPSKMTKRPKWNYHSPILSVGDFSAFGKPRRAANNDGVDVAK